MAFNQANGRQIKPGVITDLHIANGAAISESKINIDWSARTTEIFGRKLLIDYVQVNGKVVPKSVASVAVTEITANAADADDKKGAVVQTGKNKVILRQTGSGDPVISPDGTEVYGKLTNDGSGFALTFFYKDAGGSEKSFTFADQTAVDFQFPQRFDFNTIAENFAANEKFVDGASDVSARLDLEQIIKDTFGTGYSLNQNGDAVRPMTLVEELTKATSGVTNTTVKASAIIDEIVSARGGYSDLNARIADAEANITTNAGNIAALQTEVTAARGTFATVEERLTGIETSIAQEATDREHADTAIFAEFKSTEAGKGASLVGIQNVDGKIVATDVQGAFLELEDRIATVEKTGGEEVTAARSSELTGEHADLDTRLETAETRFEAVKVAVEDATQSTAKSVDEGVTPKQFASVKERFEELETEVIADAQAFADYSTANDARVDVLEDASTDHETRVTALEGQTHKHFVEDKNVVASDPLINTARYDLVGGETFVAGNKSLQVFFNGFLQMAGVHYTEVTDVNGAGIAVSFSPELIQEGDVIQLRWTK